MHTIVRFVLFGLALTCMVLGVSFATSPGASMAAAGTEIPCEVVRNTVIPVTPDMPLTILPSRCPAPPRAVLTETGHDWNLECPAGTESIDLRGGDVPTPDGMLIDYDDMTWPAYSDNQNDLDNFSLEFDRPSASFQPVLLIVGQRVETTLARPTTVYDDLEIDLGNYRVVDDGVMIFPNYIYTYVDGGHIYPKTLCVKM